MFLWLAVAVYVWFVIATLRKYKRMTLGQAVIALWSVVPAMWRLLTAPVRHVAHLHHRRVQPVVHPPNLGAGEVCPHGKGVIPVEVTYPAVGWLEERVETVAHLCWVCWEPVPAPPAPHMPVAAPETVSGSKPRAPLWDDQWTMTALRNRLECLREDWIALACRAHPSVDESRRAADVIAQMEAVRDEIARRGREVCAACGDGWTLSAWASEAPIRRVCPRHSGDPDGEWPRLGEYVDSSAAIRVESITADRIYRTGRHER